MRELSHEVKNIKKRVYGSDPPSGGGESLPPLDDSVDIAMSDAARARIDVGDLRAEMAKSFASIEQKMSAQGMGGKHLGGWLPDVNTVEGRKFIVHVLTLLLVVYATYKQIQLPAQLPLQAPIPPAAAATK